MQRRSPTRIPRGETSDRQQRLQLLHETCTCSRAHITDHTDGDRVELSCATCGRHHVVYIVDHHNH